MIDGLDALEVTDAYVFGDLLDGPESLDVVSVAFVVDLPVDEVPWRSRSVAGSCYEGGDDVRGVSVE